MKRSARYGVTVVGLLAVLMVGYAVANGVLLSTDPLVPPSYSAMREMALKAGIRHQNFLVPGCGTGREDTHEHLDRLTVVARKFPGRLRELFGDEDPDVRSAAVLMTAHTENPKYVEPLCELVRKDPDRLTRVYAIGPWRSYATGEPFPRCAGR